MKIDAHQHFWKVERGDYGWITPSLPVLYRDFLPEDLQVHLADHNIEGTILVQAAPTLEETEFILSLADQSETIKGVVGYLDLQDPLHYEHYLRFSRHAKFVGFRIMIQEMQDVSIINDAAFIEALRIYEDMQVPIDLLVRSEQLPELTKLMHHVPKLRGVINHIAKPNIADQEIDVWSYYMKELGSYSNLYCKFSGLVTEAGGSNLHVKQFEPYVKVVIECIGSNRIMFGSDWPVCLLAASYNEVVRLLVDSLQDSCHDGANKAKLFGYNAKEFYRL